MVIVTSCNVILSGQCDVLIEINARRTEGLSNFNYEVQSSKDEAQPSEGLIKINSRRTEGFINFDYISTWRSRVKTSRSRVKD